MLIFMQGLKTLCPKRPSERGSVASLPVRLLLKYVHVSNNAFYLVSSPQFKCRISRQRWNQVNALCGRYLNKRRTGKDATKPRTLGLLEQSVSVTYKLQMFVIF